MSMEDRGAEYARMRQIIKGAHGALTDAGSVVVPGTLEGDLAPAIRQLIRERDEARAEANMLWHRFQSCPACGEAGCDCRARGATMQSEELELEVARLEGLILDWESADVVSGSVGRLYAEANRYRAALRGGRK